MTEIVSSVQRVTDIIGEITAASSEQTDGIGQVNQAVAQLDQMTQQNAAMVEQSAAAAESLQRAGHQPGQRGGNVQARGRDRLRCRTRFRFEPRCPSCRHPSPRKNPMTALQDLLRHFTIHTRMRSAIAMVLALFALVGGAGLLGGAQLKSLNSEFMEHSVKEQRLVTELRVASATFAATRRTW